MKREANILITVIEENDDYKCRLQTKNISIKDFVIAAKVICNAIEKKGGKDKAKAALTAIILDSFGEQMIKELFFTTVLAKKIEKEKLDIFN